MAELELHPGVHIALARSRMNETQIARAISDGELTSPQQFANSWYYDLRITGTGGAYREGLKEYVWRDPSIYLNQTFLDRCNGLPVILEHPKGEMLDSEEYRKRNIGSIVLPYIKGDEVWGIARIIDQPAAQYMQKYVASTSPAVVFANPDNANETIREPDGKHLLVEGDPRLLDHLAICEEGVWDKGGPPAGVDSVAAKESGMADKDEIKVEEEDKRDDRHHRDDRKRDDTRRDARKRDDEEKVEVEEEEKEDSRRDAAHGEKLDKLLEGIKVLSDRMDSIESRTRDDRKRDDHARKDEESAAKEAEQAAELYKLANEEEESAKEEAEDDSRDDKRRRDSRKRDDAHRDDRRDAKKRDDEDEDAGMDFEALSRDDGEDDEEYSERADAMAAKCDAASYRKRDDESIAAHCDRVARAARRDRARRADRARMDSIDKILDRVSGLASRVDRLSKITTAPSPEDENAFADAQARADSVYSAHGDQAPRRLAGENLIGYRIRLLRGLQKHSPVYKEVDLGSVARADSAAFSGIEATVYADAAKAAETPAGVEPGRLREIKERLPGGHTATRFVGDPLAWMSTFMAPGRTTTRLRAPRER